MRGQIIALALLAAACGQPAPTEAPQDAGSSGAASVGEAPFALEPEAVVGIWSFDRTCASGDGMQLKADGAAGFDEWGDGTWAMGASDTVVLTLARSELGEPPTGEMVVYTLVITEAVTDNLVGQLTGDGETIAINAKRCPEE